MFQILKIISIFYLFIFLKYRKTPWKWQPTPVFLPEKFHGEMSLVGYSPWGCKDSGTTVIEHTCITKQNKIKQNKNKKKKKKKKQMKSQIIKMTVARNVI